MKRFILLITIVLHAAFSSDFGVYAQTIQREDVIKKDSALFHELAIDDTICPMINFQLAMRCYDFLKGYRYWERNRYVVSPGNNFWSYTDKFEYICAQNPYFRANLEYEEKNIKWDFYKDLWNDAFEKRHKAPYNESEEKRDFVERLKKFSQSATYQPLIFKIIAVKYNGSVERYVDDLYKNSIMSNKKRLKRFVRTPNFKRLDKDYGAQLTLSLMVYKYWLENRATIRPRLTGAYVYVAEQGEK